MDVVMKNPKMAKTIKEALSAPMGSTKREQAIAMLKTMKRLNPMDGKGGPATTAPIVAEPPAQPRPTSPVNILPAIPVATPSVGMNFAELEAARPDMDAIMAGGIKPVDFRGAWNKFTDWQKSISTPTSEEIARSKESGLLSQHGKTSGTTEYEKNIQVPKFLGAELRSNEYKKAIEIGKKLLSEGAMWGDVWNRIAQNFPYISKNRPEQLDKDLGVEWREAGAYERITGKSRPAQEVTAKSVVEEIPTVGATTTTGEPLATAISPTTQTSTESTSTLMTWYNNLDDNGKKYYKDVVEAIESGMGPKSYSIAAMVEDFKIKHPELAADPNVAYMASLTGQTETLSNALKKEYGLDTQRAQLDGLIKRGIDLKQNLTDYITTRDRYIEEIDKMIDKANVASIASTGGDPTLEKMSQNYLNYLYILKGRQQKRYTDFLNAGINEYNTQLTAANTAYNNTLAAYQSELEKKTSFLKEDYDNLKVAKEELYKTLDEMEKKTIDTAILKQELIKKTADNADNAAASKLGTTAKELQKAKDYFWETTVQGVYDQTGDYPTIDIGALWDKQPDSAKQYYINIVKSKVVDTNLVDRAMQLIKAKNVEYYDKTIAKDEKPGAISLQAIKFPSGTSEEVKTAVWAKLLQDPVNRTEENLGWWARLKKWWQE